ncbi:MAG: hypothetical protein WEA56_08295 [Balneolaceae bacterium]
MKKKWLLICSLGAWLLPVHLQAQVTIDEAKPDSSRTVEVTLLNNAKYYGAILSVQDREIELLTSSGKTFISLDQIRTIRVADPDDPAYGWFPNPNQSRLFFSPNAKPMQKGTGYYQNIYVFFSNAAYAVSDHVSFSAGFSMLPGLALQNQLYFISGKTGAAISHNKYIGAGIGIAAIPGSGETLFTGYGNYTYEMPRGNLTAGLHGFSIMEDVGKYSLLLGGDYRVSERIALVTENYILPEDKTTILSYGLRFMGERMSFDLAFFRPGLAEDIGFGVPYVDFVFNF